MSKPMDNKIEVLDFGVGHDLYLKSPSSVAERLSGYIKRDIVVCYHKKYNVVDGVVKRSEEREYIELARVKHPSVEDDNALVLYITNYEEKQLSMQEGLTFESDFIKNLVLGTKFMSLFYTNLDDSDEDKVIITESLIQLSLCKNHTWDEVDEVIENGDKKVMKKLSKTLKNAKYIYSKFWCKGCVFTKDTNSVLKHSHKTLLTSGIGCGASYLNGLKHYKYPLEEKGVIACGEYIENNKFLPYKMWENGDFTNVNDVECIYFIQGE